MKSTLALITNITLLLASTFVCTMFSTNSFAKDKNQQTAIDMSKVTVGIQLWSVRDKLTIDFKGTLKALSDMGFTTIETFGGFDKTSEFANNAPALKSYLNSIGLKLSGAHIGFDELSTKNLKATLKHYKILGANYLIIPWDERAWHPSQIYNFVADLNRLYPIVTQAGFAFGFHNHEQEFKPFNQHTYWDHIAQNTNPNMVLQLDAGWVNFAGKDPIHYVKAYPNRTLTTHFKVRTHSTFNKNSKQSPIIGKDGYDWAKLLKTMQKHGGIQWVILEQEEYPNGLSSLEAVAKTKAGFDGLVGGIK